MRRGLNLAIVFSLLGALCTVMMAWIMAFIARPMTIDPLRIAALRRETWEQAEHRGEDPAGAPWISEMYGNGAGEIVIVVQRSRTVERHAYGWPWRSLSGERVFEGWWRRPSRVDIRGAVRTERQLPLRYDQPGPVNAAMGVRKIPVLLPMTPRWPGFAAATMGHAIVLALLWGAFIILRGRWRRWRGRCPGCGYPIGVSAKCSECGRAVRNATLSA